MIPETDALFNLKFNEISKFIFIKNLVEEKF